MEKEQVLTRMKEDRLAVIVRAKSYEQGEKVVDAIITDGISLIELIMTMDNGDLVGFIRLMAEKYRGNNKIIIGTSIILDPEATRACILTGANYIVDSGLNVDTVRLYSCYRVLVLPDVMIPSEAITAMEAGCGITKTFPGGIVGPAAISSFKGLLSQGEFIPSGGVDVDDADKWIKTGVYVMGIGNSLTKGVKTGDFAAVIAKVREFMVAVAAARVQMIPHNKHHSRYS